MRAGYLLMGIGLVLVKWPLITEAHDQSLHEGVTLCLLTTMSLLSLFGPRTAADDVPGMPRAHLVG